MLTTDKLENVINEWIEKQDRVHVNIVIHNQSIAISNGIITKVIDRKNHKKIYIGKSIININIMEISRIEMIKEWIYIKMLGGLEYRITCTTND